MSTRQQNILHYIRSTSLLILLCSAIAACAPAGGQTSGRLVSTPKRPTPAQVFDGTPEPQPTLPGWRLVWHDEFRGDEVDPSRWTVASSLPGGFLDCCLAYGDAAWSPDHVTVSNGALHILSTADPLAGHNYTSGAISTAQTYSFTYGRVDVRARLPRSDGLWPAIWLLPVNGTAPGKAPYEIDMMEAWGADTHQVFAYFHWQTSAVQCEADGPDFSAGFHVYTLIWTPTQLQWAVDGVTQCISTSHVPNGPMYLNLSTAVGGRHQPTDSKTSLPQSTDISYVHIWTPA